MSIEIFRSENAFTGVPQDQEIIQVLQKIISKSINLKDYSISINLVDDAAIQKINLQHRNKNAATDVLSFPLGNPVANLPYVELGDIWISLQTANKQAREIGHSLQEEFYRLLVHGYLHLIGYDHETGLQDELEMKKMEDRCLGLVFEDKWD